MTSELEKSTIFNKVQSIVSDKLCVELSKVTLKANFSDDLGADSLDTVELVMAIEEAFKIEIPDEDAENIATLQQAVEFIQKSMKDN